MRASGCRGVRRSWARSGSALTTAATLVVALGACGGSGDSADTTATAAPTSTVLRVAEQDFGGIMLDPAVSYGVARQGYGELLMTTTADSRVVPALARSVERSRPTAWKVELRRGVTFQNGKAVDGEAVAAALNRQLSKRAGLKDVLPGAKIAASGRLEVTITTPKPDPQVSVKLAESDSFPVYDVSAIEKAKTDAGIAGAGAFTGPYAIKTLTAKKMVLERFDGYRMGTPPLAGVEYTFVKDPPARLAAVRSGQADIAEAMNTVGVKRAVASAGDVLFKLSDAPLDGIRLYFNLTRAPFDDAAVRQALLMAIDYETIATRFFDGTFDAPTGLFPGTYPDNKPTIATDVAKARSLLDAAGWTRRGSGTRSKDGKPLEFTILTYTQRPELKTAALALQSELAPLGIAIKINDQSYDSKLFADLAGWGIALYVDYALSGTGQPDANLPNYLLPDGFANFGRIDDRKLTSLLRELATAPDDATRRRVIGEVQDVVITQKAYVGVVAFKRDGVVVSKDWRSYVPSVDTAAFKVVDFETHPG